MSLKPIATEPDEDHLDQYDEIESVRESDTEEDNDAETFYLDDDNILSRELDNDVEITGANKPISIYLCLYKIADELATPFLEFYLENTSNDCYSFPHFTIEPDDWKTKLVLEPIPDSGDEPEYNNTIVDKVYEKSEPFFMQLTNTSDDVSEKCYKGFIQSDDTTFFVVFDCNDTGDGLNLNMENNAPMMVILDEIIRNKKVLNIPIEPKILDFLNEHDYMKYITDNDNHPVSIPNCMYMVENINGVYENVEYEEGERRANVNSPIHTQVDHPIFGLVYLFSYIPLENSDGQNITPSDETSLPFLSGRYKRFAVFTQDTLYMMNQTYPLGENLAEYRADFDDFSTVCFYEDGIEYIATRKNGVFMEI